MRVHPRVTRAAASAVGVAAAGGLAAGFARQRRQIRRRPEDYTRFGSLHSPPRTVVAEDGVALHVEVDEMTGSAGGGDGGRRLRGRAEPEPITVVFCHGYALNLDCWHFQRMAYRGLVRAVYYDQRSHGRSGRAPKGNATIEHLGRDLGRVLDEVVPDGPVVLVGHSMGGMTIVALAEERPDLFADRVVGVSLIATTAGGLDPSRILLPLLPAKLGGRVAHAGVRALARGHRAIDNLRRAGRSVALVATDLFAFGDDVPVAYVDFVDSMLSATPFEVVAEFFPSFRSLDKFHAVEVLGSVPTTIICGTSDRLTRVEHSRKLHERIAGSRLIECEGAGHMVLMERHARVNAALDQLLGAAAEVAGLR